MKIFCPFVSPYLHNYLKIAQKSVRCNISINPTNIKKIRSSMFLKKLHHVIKYYTFYKRKIDTKIIYAQIMIRVCQLIEKLSLFLS